MKRAPSTTIALRITLVSLLMAYPIGLAAGDRSGRGGGVDAGGVSVGADRGGASVSAGGASVSADRGGASVSADRGGSSVSAGRDGAGAGAGGATASADRGGAGVSAGGASVSADRGGAGVSAGGASVSADRGDISADPVNNRKVSGMRNAQGARPVGDRSYGSLGEWFDDLRASWFGGRNDGSDKVTSHSSASQKPASSDSTGIQVNQVTQKKSSKAIALDGGSAVAKASNVNVTEQKQ